MLELDLVDVELLRFLLQLLVLDLYLVVGVVGLVAEENLVEGLRLLHAAELLELDRLEFAERFGAQEEDGVDPFFALLGRHALHDEHGVGSEGLCEQRLPCRCAAARSRARL